MRRTVFVATMLALAACTSESTPTEEPAPSVNADDRNTTLTDAVQQPLDRAAEVETMMQERKSRLDDALAESGEGSKDDED